MAQITVALNYPRRAYRIAVSCLFFLQGICFASWASRIPTIKTRLSLTDAQLGGILLSLPVGSMIALVFSGWLVTKFGSRRVATNAVLSYSLVLLLIGLANSIPLLVASLVLFGIAGNLANIAINTQAIGVESHYGKNIMASFHGVWSLAGFTAAGIGGYMIGHSIIPLHHFTLVTGATAVALIAAFQFLMPDAPQSQEKTPFFIKPDKTLINLGIIAFCCMMCEGAMFDWSGIYFQTVVKASPDKVGLGYTAFMCTMATGRFISDRVVGRAGVKKTLQFSGALIAAGLLIAIVYPVIALAIAGFLIVGFGVSSVVPLVYSQAGKSSRIPPGIALASVSSIGFLGFLAGPPVIGIVAGFFGLQVSFLIIACVGMLVLLMARKIK